MSRGFGLLCMLTSLLAGLVVASPVLAQGGAGKEVDEVEGSHPLITEVLFAVPVDDGSGLGDANGDGVRSVNGDEFVEIVNPHEEAIQLAGYVLRDSAVDETRRFEFVFPELELGPGGCVVVFNGRNCRWDGPVGDTNRAPEAAHPDWHGAYLFTARCSSRVSFANAGDWVMLVGPDGARMQCVSWGSPRVRVPEDVARVEDVGRVIGSSVQRSSADGELIEHVDLDERLYSPGEGFVELVEEEGGPPPESRGSD